MILQLLGAGLGILGGLGQAQGAKKIGKAKKEQLNWKADLNKEKIDEAYTINYAKLLNQYSNERNNLLNNKRDAENNIRVTATSGVSDIVDIAGSSFLTTASGTLDNEFETSMRELSDWKFNNALEMQKAVLAQKLDIDLGVISAEAGIDQEVYNAQRQGYMNAINSALGMGNTLMSYKSDQNAQSSFNNIVGAYDKSVVTGQQFYSPYQTVGLDPYKLTSGNTNSQNRLDLKYFGR